jgi:hypothetical protein
MRCQLANRSSRKQKRRQSRPLRHEGRDLRRWSSTSSPRRRPPGAPLNAAWRPRRDRPPFRTLPEPKVCAGCAQVLWTPVCDIGYMRAILGRAKGHDHQAACGPSRLGAYVVRLCAFANWRSCRWRDRTRGHRSPLVQRTSLLSLRLGMASSPLRGLVYTVRLWSLIATGAAARRGSQARRLAPHALLRR